MGAAAAWVRRPVRGIWLPTILGSTLRRCITKKAGFCRPFYRVCVWSLNHRMRIYGFGPTHITLFLLVPDFIVAVLLLLYSAYRYAVLRRPFTTPI